MKFDLFCLMQQADDTWSAEDVFADVTAQVAAAEAGGMDTVWFAEHHFSNYSLCPSPLMAAAHFAAKTERLKLGTAVVVLPLYEPMRLAQEVGMVDVLSGGRLVLGIGSGYQAYEFERFRTVLDADVMERTLEAADVIETALTQPDFTHQGKHYTYPHTQIASKAKGGRMPDMWVAGMHPALLERVAKRGYGLMLTPSWKAIETIAPARATLDDLCAAHGRDPATVPLGLMRFIHVTDSRAQAREAAERARYSSRVSLALRLDYAKLNGIFAQDTPSQGEPSIDEMMDNYIIGDVDTCIEKILHDHAVMGHTNFLCNLQLGGVPHERVMHTLEALATDIMPAVDKALGPSNTAVTAQ